MFGGGTDDSLDGVSGSDRHSRLLYDDLAALGDFCDFTGTQLDILDVGGVACQK